MRRRSDRTLPRSMRWIFWDVDFEALRLQKHADAILARILENGRMEDVRWALDTYGAERIHEFFRSSGHPLISARTRAFWRAYFRAGREKWNEPPAWRRLSSAPWRD